MSKPVNVAFLKTENDFDLFRQVFLFHTGKKKNMEVYFYAHWYWWSKSSYSLHGKGITIIGKEKVRIYVGADL